MKRTLQKGFTLVEVLIVLIMIGVIAWLFISNFSNPIKSGTVQASANKVAEDMRSVADAADKFLVDKQKVARTISGATGAEVEFDLVEKSYLKFHPVKVSTMTADYSWDKTTYSAWGTAAADVVMVAPIGDNAALCAKINEMFTGLDEAAAATIPAAVQKKYDLQCFGTTPNYIIAKPIYVN